MAQEESESLKTKDGAEQWVKPEVNSIKINVDAAIFEEQNRFGVAWVIRDHNGLLLNALTKLFIGSTHPTVVEAISFREALSWLKTHPVHTAIIETDCLLVVQALRSTIHTSSLFGEIISDCKVLLTQVSNVSFNFVKRSANVVAHEFARASMLHPDRVFSMGNIPTELLPCVVAEFEG
uniref:RNase H type-1 domain-containing protein n=1 Tax=Cannabis sativa TaxID=3483 RepID=A0A803Q518_CANSA